MQTLNFEFLKCEIAKIQESFTLLGRMTENELPDELPSSREAGEDPETHPEQVVEVQKALDRL